MISCQKYLFITLLAFAYIPMYAQDGESQKKQEKRVLEQRTQQEAEQEQAQIAMNNQHMAIQKKKTRKRMKKSKKKAKKVNEHKGDFFLVRLFKNRNKGF